MIIFDIEKLQQPAPYEWQVLCLGCGASYLYREYPPYSTCFNCGAKALEVRDLR